MKTDKSFYRRGFTDKKDLTNEEIDELKANVEKAYKELKYTTSFEEACKDADLIIESISEIPQQKKALFHELAKYMEEKTIIVTNTSSILPSELAEHTGRPEKFLALHFANNIWRCNIAEVMGHSGTDQQYIDKVIEFAERINMVPLRILKEQKSYLLNSMLTPFLDAARSLWARDIADPQTIDKAWTIGTGAPVGPFTILDMIGCLTSYNVKLLSPHVNDPNHIDYLIAKKYKEMIDAGKLGILSGEGFYKYR